jgi:hypothetical protein
VDYVFFADWLIVDDNALAKINEVRRHVSADAQAFGSQERIQRDDDASLPVRSRNVKGSYALVWISKDREDLERPLEAELCCRACALEQRVERCAVTRQAAVHPAAAGFPLMCLRS